MNKLPIKLIVSRDIADIFSEPKHFKMIEGMFKDAVLGRSEFAGILLMIVACSASSRPVIEVFYPYTHTQSIDGAIALFSEIWMDLSPLTGSMDKPAILLTTGSLLDI
jgi:hypothetical protein